jgi:hypothetical protein
MKMNTLKSFYVLYGAMIMAGSLMAMDRTADEQNLRQRKLNIELAQTLNDAKGNEVEQKLQRAENLLAQGADINS